MQSTAAWAALNPPAELVEILEACPGYEIAQNVEELVAASCGGADKRSLAVEYRLPDGRQVTEATVVRVRNGIAANYPDPYMRRRDPNCMFIADSQPTDKPTFIETFGYDFESLRRETLDWLKTQELVVMAFQTGRPGLGDQALAVVPKNAAFFAFGLALLQGMLSPDELDEFKPQAVIYVAPPFRHTHFNGKQVVVHNRLDNLYELFSYNLYPGPSAKKGVYGMLIGQGEAEGWVTAHCSTVQVITPYDNLVSIMHEGASGGGKSEMLQQAHRMPDGRLLLGRNILTGEERYLEIPRMCQLRPVTDDMALCHPSVQQGDGKLWVLDAEDGWFVRVDHIKDYGTDIDLEKLTSKPPRPLLFLNIDAVPDSRALIWEHIEDRPGKTCPNPRVVIPRNMVPDVVDIDESVRVDIRSLGVRTPPCTKENPSYGILGLMHVLPPALAWLWRLVAPRGYANPSITDSEGISSEGVGSYWPFATGRQVTQANLLLEQIKSSPRVQYILTPNQHIGAWATSFMPQWIARDFLARRGSARFRPGQIVPARCPLLGNALYTMRVEGTTIPRWFLQVETQPEVGVEGYDKGAEILYNFFRESLSELLGRDLDPLGRQIIETCLNGGSVEDYERLLPSQVG